MEERQEAEEQAEIEQAIEQVNEEEKVKQEVPEEKEDLLRGIEEVEAPKKEKEEKEPLFCLICGKVSRGKYCVEHSDLAKKLRRKRRKDEDEFFLTIKSKNRF